MEDHATMRRLAILLLVMLSGCATTGDELGAKPVQATAHVSAAPETVAACIQTGTPGLYTPSESRVGGQIIVTWRQEPIGVVATFTISPSGDGSAVEIRQIGPLGGQMKKVAHCYA
jgi:starvation-inducible outer membrane lipoprotein